MLWCCAICCDLLSVLLAYIFLSDLNSLCTEHCYVTQALRLWQLVYCLHGGVYIYMAGDWVMFLTHLAKEVEKKKPYFNAHCLVEVGIARYYTILCSQYNNIAI